MATNYDEDISKHRKKSAPDFSGFKWLGTPPAGAFRVRNDFFRDSMVNWSALNALAASLRSTECVILESIGYGHSHMIRQIQFVDGVSRIARLAMPPFNFNENEKYLPKLDIGPATTSCACRASVTRCHLSRKCLRFQFLESSTIAPHQRIQLGCLSSSWNAYSGTRPIM